MICVEIRISIDTLIESLATCWTYSDVVRVYVYGERLNDENIFHVDSQKELLDTSLWKMVFFRNYYKTATATAKTIKRNFPRTLPNLPQTETLSPQSLAS